MRSDDREERQRLRWVRLYEETGDAGLVCRRCGISRPTLRKWWRRYQAVGKAGLRSRSRRPRRSPQRRVSREIAATIVDLRRRRRLGPKRIQGELLRHWGTKLSTATIWKVLRAHGCAPLHRPRRHSSPTRYNRPLPGDRVQIDTMKVAPGRYQFTAVDDCTRLRVLGLYPRRTVQNAVHFLEERILEEFPFPVQRVQTDRGTEFFGLAFQRALRHHAIKFRPIRPRAPHLNGKVERSQHTDWLEFYAVADLQAPDLPQQLEEWQFFYNWHRPHSALSGRTPMERCCELLERTPLREEVAAQFDRTREPYRERRYDLDLRLRELKRSR